MNVFVGKHLWDIVRRSWWVVIALNPNDSVELCPRAECLYFGGPITRRVIFLEYLGNFRE